MSSWWINCFSMLKITLFIPVNIVFFKICVSASNVATLGFSFVGFFFFIFFLLFVCYLLNLCNAGDPGSLPGSGKSLGEGNGNPFQHFYLENSIDRGTWWSTVHRVTKSQTWLSMYKYTWLPDQEKMLSHSILFWLAGMLDILSVTIFLNRSWKTGD